MDEGLEPVKSSKRVESEPVEAGSNVFNDFDGYNGFLALILGYGECMRTERQNR